MNYLLELIERNHQGRLWPRMDLLVRLNTRQPSSIPSSIPYSNPVQMMEGLISGQVGGCINPHRGWKDPLRSESEREPERRPAIRKAQPII